MDKSKIFKQAQKNKIAIGQFNFSDLSQFKGILSAAKIKKTPFILGTSEGEAEFLGMDLAVSLRNLAEKELGLPVVLNLDHGKSFDIVKKAIDAGYDMVHFDGSALPLEENIKITKKVKDYANKKGVLVEGELGYLRGTSSLHKKCIKIEREDMTLPSEAKLFLKGTGVDFLAVVIGNVHGLWVKMPHLDLKCLNMIENSIGFDAFLVLHGGSGIADREIKKAISAGVVKINVNTEIRVAWKNSIQNTLKSNKDEVAPYKLLRKTPKQIEKVVLKKMELFIKY
jgi:fructose-bisphosphate aldolase class II